MADEFASMPQSMLREVVLRLICPESPPPITADSRVELRERQATEIFRSQAARELVRSREALDFLNRFNAQSPLLDEIADLFLTVAETHGKADHLLNPYVTSMFSFEEVLYAFEVVMLGASPEMMEREMVQLVRGGWDRDAEKLAERLGRVLTRDEVLRIVESYTRGAVYSREDDKRWPEFARRHLGDVDAQLVKKWIADRNERARNDIY